MNNIRSVFMNGHNDIIAYSDRLPGFDISNFNIENESLPFALMTKISCLLGIVVQRYYEMILQIFLHKFVNGGSTRWFKEVEVRIVALIAKCQLQVIDKYAKHYFESLLLLIIFDLSNGDMDRVQKKTQGNR